MLLLQVNNNILSRKRFNIKNTRSYPITITRCNNKTVNNASFARTNVIGDFIEKYTSDVNMLHQIENEEYSCKYVALFNSILIIGLIIFMFFDSSQKNDND